MDLVRQEIAASATTVVVKVGTRVLTQADGMLDGDRIASLAEDLAACVEQGRRVVLISSGAVGAGIGRLGLQQRPRDISRLQAVAAIGQSRLIEAYNRALERHDLHAAQVLLTTDDLNDRTRYLNVRNTLLALFQLDAVPIINENDTVSVEELQIGFGDNDQLAAMVTNLLRAPLLVLLSDVAGVYDGPPERPDSRIIGTITNVDAMLDAAGDPARRLGGYSTSGTASIAFGSGGIASKLRAARMVAAAGENAVIADGRTPGILRRILAAEPVGTLVVAHGASVASRKRWIGFTAAPVGKLFLDDGAEKAIVEKGRSLLAVGVTQVEGEFVKGDVVSLCSQQGNEIARGMPNYASSELKKIAGHSTDQIASLLGHRPYDEVIHRDNLALNG